MMNPRGRAGTTELHNLMITDLAANHSLVEPLALADGHADQKADQETDDPPD